MFDWLKRKPAAGMAINLAETRRAHLDAQAEHQRCWDALTASAERVKATAAALSEAKKRVLDAAEQWALNQRINP